MSRGGKAKMQPSLFHIEVGKDVEYTPAWLAKDMVEFFLGSMIRAFYKDHPEKLLDPCSGKGAFLSLLPAGAGWCEIEQGVDFYAFTDHVDWAISNPPYSHLLAWIEYSMKVADNFCYLIPIHRVWNSNEFLDKLDGWGGIKHIRRYGTGTQCGFPFGHAIAAIHFERDYQGPIYRSKYVGARR
jgi:hypothetical protein